MNFFIESTIGCTITLLGYWYLSDIIFQKKSKKDLLCYLIIIGYAILITLLNVIGENSIDKIIKVIIVFVVMIFFNKYKYKRKISDTILGTLIIYVNFYLAEVAVVSVLSIFFKVLGLNLFGILKYSLFANLTTTIMSFVLMFLLKKIYIKLFKNLQFYDLNLLIAGIVVLLIVTLLVTKTPIDEWQLNMDFITTMLLITMFCFLGIYMIKQKSDTDKITDKYIKLAKYSQNNEGLLEEYRMNLHENKNRLIRIDNMVPEEYTELHEYIGELIEINRSNKYYWLTELKYVPSPELKGFINYKLMEMINDKLEVEVNISREINKRILKNYSVKDKEDLYSIVGILLDNAHEASKISKEKSVSIQMFMTNKELVLIVANTYKGKIKIDKIDEYGYSSKGKNRGTGLHIINEIVNRNELFSKETSLLDNYFVQTINIKYKKLKSNKKKKV